jgi:hypothetical protein
VRSALIALVCYLGVVTGVSVCVPALAGAAPPSMPDLRDYPAVAPDAFVVGNAAYFRTPDGLRCAIQPDRGAAGCDGRLPGAPAGANELVLAADVYSRGLRATANPGFGRPAGDTAPVLREGQKIVFADFECAVGTGAFTACTKGTPPTQWMVVSPARTGIGPETEGLPEDFPDPDDFVVGDESYVVGAGAKNMFPIFTVGAGLTCSIIVYSGGEFGCDGPLPGVAGGDNEVFTQLPGTSGTRRTDSPKFSTPAYQGPIKQLPVGFRVNGIGSTCMAIAGGTACIGTLAGATQGFEVSSAGVSTFGG